MSELPVAQEWFRMRRVTEDVVLLAEDHLDTFFEFQRCGTSGAGIATSS